MSFKPNFTLKSNWFKPASNAPPFEPLETDRPCAFWFSSGKTRYRQGVSEWPIHAQLAISRVNYYGAIGWSGKPPVFDPYYAFYVTIHDDAGTIAAVHPVLGQIMWAGTPDEHFRYDCTQVTVEGVTNSPLPELYDQLDSARQGRETTASIYRPFGASVPFQEDIPVYMYPGTRGPVSSNFAFNFPDFDNVLLVRDTVDIRDGNTRNIDVDGALFHDGDEVRIPSSPLSSRYVVVRVERTAGADGVQRKRVYILRHSAVWPGP